MKNVLSLLLLFLIIGCYQKIDNKSVLIEKIENSIKETMNDPSSFEFISFESNLQKEQEYKDGTGDNSSDARFYDFKFRGKNSYGALVIDQVTVLTDKEFIAFSIAD